MARDGEEGRRGQVRVGSAQGPGEEHGATSPPAVARCACGHVAAPQASSLRFLHPTSDVEPVGHVSACAAQNDILNGATASPREGLASISEDAEDDIENIAPQTAGAERATGKKGKKGLSVGSNSARCVRAHAARDPLHCWLLA